MEPARAAVARASAAALERSPNRGANLAVAELTVPHGLVGATAPAAQARLRAIGFVHVRLDMTPTKAPKDERALYDFIKELHQKRRVSDRTYKPVHALLGDAGMVEFLGILGSYTLTSMVLNTFRVPLPAGVTAPFKEPAL